MNYFSSNIGVFRRTLISKKNPIKMSIFKLSARQYAIHHIRDRLMPDQQKLYIISPSLLRVFIRALNFLMALFYKFS